jgi:hypothetical protein
MSTRRVCLPRFPSRQTAVELTEVGRMLVEVNEVSTKGRIRPPIASRLA